MPDLKENREHIEDYGSREAAELASVVYGSAQRYGRAAWDGMETLRRLSDVELEIHTMRLLVSKGYSFTFGSDGVRVGILSGEFYTTQDLPHAIYCLASTFCIPASDENPIGYTDTWSDELRSAVKNYLASQGLAPDKYEKLGRPDDECRPSIEYCVVEVDPHLLVTEGDPFGPASPDDAA